VDEKHFIQNQSHRTQTHKTRFERWENVGSVFKISNPAKLEGKHVLLTDDVITTGSTLEACANSLLAIGGVSVSIATIACAMKMSAWNRVIVNRNNRASLPFTYHAAE